MPDDLGVFEDEIASFMTPSKPAKPKKRNQKQLDFSKTITLKLSELEEFLDGPKTPPPPLKVEALVEDLIEVEQENEVFYNEGLTRKLIGRRDEMKRLIQFFKKIWNTKATASISVVGESGLGKTKLVADFIARLQKKAKIEIIQIRAKLNIQNEDYFLFKGILKQLIGIHDGDVRDIKGEKLKRFLKEHAPTHLFNELKVIFNHFLDIKLSGDIGDMDLSSYDRILKRSFRQLLKNKTKKQPLLLAIEDFHHTDSRSMEMIEYFLSLPNYSNIIFLMTSELRERINPFLKGGAHKRYFIKLLPLVEEDAQEMVREILRDVPNLDHNTILKIVENCKGNPHFIEESIHFLQDAEVLKMKQGHFVSIDKELFKRTHIPLTLEEAMLAKLRRMNQFHFAVLQLAAVCGPLFYRDMLQILINVDLMVLQDPERSKRWMKEHLQEEINQVFESLIELGILSKSDHRDEEYRFNHETEHQLVYQSIPIKMRRLYHSYLAQYLETAPGYQTGKNLRLISYHYNLASNPYKAAKYLFIMAKNARDQYANEKAIEYYQEALNLLPEENLLNRFEMLINLGELYMLMGRAKKAIKLFSDMANLGMIIQYHNKVGVAYNKLGRIYRDTGAYDKAEDSLMLAYDYFNMRHDILGIASTMDDIGKLNWLQGNFEEALKRYMSSLKIRKKLNNPYVIARSLDNIGILYFSQGFVSEAEEYLHEAYQIRKQLKDQWGIMISLNNLAKLAAGKGDEEEANSLLMQSLNIAQEIGDIFYQITCMNHLGALYLENQHFDQSKLYLKQALEIALENSNQKLLAEVYQNLGDYYFQTNEISEARTFLEKALDLSSEIGDKQIKGRVYCLLGNLEGMTLFSTAQSVEQVEPAEDYYLQSLDLLRRVSEPLMAKTCIAYASYLLNKGKRGKARKLLMQAEQICETHNMQLQMSIVRGFIREL